VVLVIHNSECLLAERNLGISEEIEETDTKNTSKDSANAEDQEICVTRFCHYLFTALQQYFEDV